MDDDLKKADTNFRILPDNAPSTHQQLLAKWVRLTVDHTPCLEDFDFEKSFDLPHEPFLLERTDGPDLSCEFRFRRASSGLNEFFERNITGLEVREVLRDMVNFKSLEALQQSLGLFEPHYWEKVHSFYGRQPIHYHRLVLPLTDSEGHANWLFGSLIWIGDPMGPATQSSER